jgi:hypothetical protein
MKERPILFNRHMVLALLYGTKTQTRRIVKLDKQLEKWNCELSEAFINAGLAGPDEYLSVPAFGGDSWHRLFSPYETGNRLWVKETHYWDRFEKLPKVKPADFPMDFYYRADGECCQQIPECQCGSEGKTRWRPSIFMPRWASRLTLEISNVRVERLNDISEADAEAEGVDFMRHIPDADETLTARKLYEILWESINGEGSWKKNPWVWAVSFKKL